MAELNFTGLPRKAEQAATNVKPSAYALLSINTSISGSYVATLATSAWASATGTGSRATFATYTAPTISASPTQAEVQVIANATQVNSQRLKALIDDLKAAGVI